MSAADVSIVHPLDPAAPGLGGFDTCINDFIRYAPQSWTLEVIGVTSSPEQRPVGRASQVDVGGRLISFTPATADPEPDKVRPIPLSLRFVMACRGRRLRPAGRIEQLHRFESVFAHRAAGRRRALFLHNDPFELVSQASEIRWRGLSRLYWAALGKAVGRSDALFVVHPDSQQSLGSRFPASRNKIRRLPVWADPQVFRPAPDPSSDPGDRLRQQFGLPQGCRLLVYAGRFAAQKNLGLLLATLAVCRQRQLDCALLLIGKGPQEPRLRRQIEEMALGGFVRLVPTVERQTLADIYRGCDLAVCSSHYEAGPRQVLEALACGTPVASTAVGQVPEILAAFPAAGELAADPSPESLARAIQQVLEGGDPSVRRRQCLAAAAAYHPASVLASVYQLYQNWLDERPNEGEAPDEAEPKR